MIQYPLVNISKEDWNKKVAATYMYSIPLEDEALPILTEIVDILQHLHSQPIHQVIPEEHLEYFFTQVFPPVCQKILKSRYFKSQKILQLGNRTLELSVNLVARYVEYAEKWPLFAQLLITVYSADQYYYKTNNQFIDHRSFTNNFIKDIERNWVDELKEGDLLDVLKFSHLSGKATWSRAKVLVVKQSKIKIEYLNDYYEETTTVDKNSYLIAPYKSKSDNFDWRMNLKAGDLVDCEDHYGGWYGSTILQILEKEEDRKIAKITFKIYDENGNKFDEKGRYFGLSGYTEQVDVTSPKLQPYGSLVKEKCYDSGFKSLQDNDDLNDAEFEDLCGQRLYALPRKKILSQFLFQAINSFGRLGGFQKPIQRLQQTINITFLSMYVKGISGVGQCLNKNLVKTLVEQLKPIIERHIFCQSEQFLKQFTKDRSEMLFSGFKVLQRRIYSMQAVYEYENEKKMKLVDRCLQSESLKRKLQGLNQLKDVVKSLTYSSERNKSIKKWIKEEKLFEKIYLTNSHVQLIKKSEEFFRYLINESILEVTDLERLYKIAQKGDYESRISLYKLFQQVSHIFKKPHVDFLIDTILESQLSLILNEDIDLLNEMSKFSNYFPKDKVRSFFESIILGQIQHEALYQYATKKYSEIVSKGYEMKSYRRDIIHSFINKLNTHNITQVIKVLKGIFQGIGVGDYGKKDLNEILAEQNIDEVIILAIRNNKDNPQWSSIVSEVLHLLGFIYKLSYKVKILISTLRNIWNELNGHEAKRKEYYRWVNELIGCEQGIGQSTEIAQFQIFFKELFPIDQLHSINVQQFHLMKNLIIEINKKNKFLTPVHLIKELEYKRKVEMHQLKLTDYFMHIIYNIDHPDIVEKGLEFFLEIYNAKQNQIEDVHQLFNNLLQRFYQYKQAGLYSQVQKTLKLINILIDNSEKHFDLEIQSLVTKEKSESISLTIINDIIYTSENAKKKQFIVPLNLTLYQFKKILTTHYTIEIDEVKLSQEKQLPEYFNSRVIKELPINFNDPISLTKRYTNSYNEPEMLINNKLNPKAVRCWKIIFERYSTDGQMNKQQCHQFTAACLSSMSKRYDDKVNYLFSRYDYNNDGLLALEEFLTFYEDAARQNKSSTVWSNLRSFGVDSDFKFINQANKPLSLEKFPRKILSQSAQFYDALFELLPFKEIAPIAFHLLQRLPISKKIYHQILGIGKVTKKEELDIENIFKFQDHYSYFYKLSIISYLTESTLQTEREWLNLFIESHGVELIYSELKNFMLNYQKENEFEQIEIEIINYNIKLLYEYFLRCFAKDNILQALALLNYDVDIDDKIEYLVTDSFPKSEEKLTPIHVTSIYEWRGDSKVALCQTFILFLKKIWIDWSDKIEKQHSKLLIYHKLLSIICLLQTEEDPKVLIQQFAVFFERPPSNRLLRQFYCLILNLCFYSQENQNQYITEMFKHITVSNITSEYFKILAVLVAKFGLEQQRVCEMPEILLNNILHQKNQLTIEGCAKLLSNFHLSKQVAEEQINLLWQNCLFGLETSCKKQQTRQAIYELILKVCENNKQVTDTVIKKTLETIATRFKSIKITYSTEVNQRSATGYAGLKNLGNICYMNSMIQQLFMNKTFRYLLMRINDHKQPHWTLDSKQKMVDDNFLHQIQRIFGYLQKTTRVDFIPSAFCVAYKPFGQSVNIMMQQDVQQFVSMFFDRLESGIKEHPLKRLIDNFYSGKSTNLISCHDCNQTKKVEENFFSLSLEVKNSKNLAQSFGRFILGELISDYKCNFCNKKADVSKKTRISKNPHSLIIHLKRIDLNLQTFLNQKLTNKHEFPTNFNLYPYSLEYYEREQQNDANLTKQHPHYQYQLTGIICHIGNGEMGHYISYIKNQQGKWFQFNDSLVQSFNPSNIEAECFGGSFTYDDQYDWEKRENSKSAYLLIYQRTAQNLIELQVKSEQQKVQLLNKLNLIEDVRPASLNKNQQEPTESQEQSSEKVQDSEKEKENRLKIEMEQIEMVRKHKSEDNIEVIVKMVEEKMQKTQKIDDNGNLIIKIKDKITPYIDKQLETQIEADNQIHFFEKCIASTSFSKFFAKLLILPQNNSQQIVKLCQKMTFGFWLKSPSFKQLIYSLSQYIKSYPSGLKQILTQNTNLVTLLIEHSQMEVRTNIANFLANSFSYYIQDKNLTIDEQDLNPENQLVIKFLDNLFSLIPTTVSKCWTKFNQYFQFWYEFSKKTRVAGIYMVRKQFVKHFIDYFLDKKSPLKIYKNRPQIGSSYANPNFSMLLRTIESLIQFYIDQKIPLSKDENIILMNFNFIQKLIHDGYQSIASKIVKIICPKNLYASEKIAIVLLKGISKSNFQNIQSYLDVLHEFVLIRDENQHLRIIWTLGKQTLVVSTISKTLSAMNAYSLEDRIYEFQPALNLQSGSSLLQPLFVNNKRTENFCIICLQQLLKLCNQSDCVGDYVWKLGPPNYLFGKYVDFFEEFINRYIEESKRIYGYSTNTSFNRQELGKNTKRLYEQYLVKIKKVDTHKARTNQFIGKEIAHKKYKNYIEAEQAISSEKENKSSMLDNSSDRKDQDYYVNQEFPSLLQAQIHRTHSEEKGGNMPNLTTIKSKDSDEYNVQFQQRSQPYEEIFYSESDKGQEAEQIKPNKQCIDKNNQGPSKENKYQSFSEDDFLKIENKKSQQYQKNDSSPPNSPLKQQEKAQKKGSCDAEPQQIEKYYHPVKFIYKAVEQLESGMDNVKIQQHASEVVLVRTYPTGITNRAFTSTYSHKKVSERLDDKIWEDKKTEVIKGYFISNNTKSTIRLQTDDGSYYIRSLQGGWIWSSYITRIWVPQRFNQWPEWSLYSEQSNNVNDASSQEGFR